MRLDLDNNEYFEVIVLPGGEPHMKWKKHFESKHGHFLLSLVARIQSGTDLMKLVVATDAIKRSGEVWGINAIIPYWPGARQDRAKYGEPLTAKVYADIINAQKYEMVTIVDPHSDVTPALIDNVNVVPVSDILKKIVGEYKYDTILIPDAGATKRMFSYYFPDTEFNKGLTFVQCLKTRDTETGKLSGFRVVDEIPKGASCLIVDDICDGGGTFIGLANELVKTYKEKNTALLGKLGLYTTHGIYSKGIDPLLFSKDNLDGVFDNVFCTDSFKRPELYGVQMYNLEY